MSENDKALAKYGLSLVGKHGSEVSSHVGTYYDNITIALLERYPRRHITLDELCRVHFDKVNAGLMSYVRSQMWRSINKMLEQGKLAFIKYGYRGRIVSMKLFDRTSPRDERDFNKWLERYIKRKEQTDTKLAMIELLLRRPPLPR